MVNIGVLRRMLALGWCLMMFDGECECDGEFEDEFYCVMENVSV